MVEAMEIQKGFKKTEVGVIPNDWKLLPVSKFGEVKRGAGSQYIKYVNYNGIRFIRINDFFEDSPVYVSPTVDMMRFAITESDVLFAGTGASAGASYIPKKEWIGLPHSYNAPRIRTNENHSKEFLLHTLQSEYIAKQQRAWFVGAAQPFLDLNAISNFLIATPPTKAEQTDIAEALNDADTLIAELEKLIAKKKAIKQGAMQELLKPKEGWEVKTIGEIAIVGRGRVISHKEISKSIEVKYPVYSSQTFNNGVMGYLDTYDFDGEYLTWTTDGVYAGKVYHRNGQFNCTNVCGTIKLKKDYAPFVAYLLDTITPDHVSRNLANPKLMNDPMKRIEIPLPNHEEQIHIAQTLSDMDAEIAVLEKKLDKYKMLKQGMMQNLLTGRIRLI